MDKSVLLGRSIRNLRSQRQLSQAELAERSGLTPETIAEIERGSDPGTLDTLRGLAVGLDMLLSDLLASIESVAEPSTVLADLDWALGLTDALRPVQPEVEQAIQRRLWCLCAALELAAIDQGKETPAVRVHPELPPRVMLDDRVLEYVRGGEGWKFRAWLDTTSEVEQLMPEGRDLFEWIAETAREVIAEWVEQSVPATDPEIQA